MGVSNSIPDFYHSAQRRFTNADPLGGSVSNPQSLNRYAYVRNDPVNLVDPLGLATQFWLCTVRDHFQLH